MSHVDVTKRAIWQDSEVHAMLAVIKELDVLRKIDGRTQRNKQIFMSLQEESAEQQIFHSWSVCKQRSDDCQQFMHHAVNLKYLDFIQNLLADSGTYESLIFFKNKTRLARARSRKQCNSQ